MIYLDTETACVCVCVCLQSSAARSGRRTDARHSCDVSDSDDDDRIRNRMRQYEKKIELLLQQVAELEAEVCIVSKCHAVLVISLIFAATKTADLSVVQITLHSVELQCFS